MPEKGKVYIEGASKPESGLMTRAMTVTALKFNVRILLFDPENNESMVQNTDAAPQNTSSANNPVNAGQVSQKILRRRLAF